MWPQTVASYAGDEYVVKIRDKGNPHRTHLHVAVRDEDPVRWCCRATRMRAKSSSGN